MEKLYTSPQTQEDLEIFFDSPFESSKETEESCTTFVGEHPIEHEIEEISTCLLANLVRIPETNYLDLHGMTKEAFQSVPNEEVEQDHHDYIEQWFQITIKLKYHSFLPLLFVSHLSKQLVLRIFVCIKVYFSKLSMNVFLYLLRTWLHWKYSYTWRRSSFLHVE